MVYLGMRWWLSAIHRLRWAWVVFDGLTEEGETPRQPSGTEVKAMREEHDQYINRGGPEDGPRDPVKLHGMKHIPCFFALPYWSVSQLPLSFSQMMFFEPISLYLFLQSSS